MEPTCEKGIDFETTIRNVAARMMKSLSFPIIVLLAVGATGCGGRSATAAKSRSPDSPAIVTPDSSLEATVVAVNAVGRFVVLSFSGLQMPKAGQACFIYRAGLKVAEVRITGPQQDNNIVADLLSGDAQVGDTVRDE